MAETGQGTSQTSSPRGATQVITYDAVAPLLQWREVTEALHRGHTQARPELGDLLLGPPDALLLNRAAYIAGIGYAVKVETVIPGNAGQGLPTVQGAVILHDPHDGSVRAVIDSQLVTTYKTAADSVLAAQLLARPESEQLLIVGAGPVAASLARAYTALFPRLNRVSVWARRPVQAHALLDSLTDVSADLSVASDLRSAAQAADIIASATSAREPILFGEWIQPGTHIDLVGAFTPDMREADDALMTKAHVYVDLRATTIDVIGELTQPIAAGAISRDDVRGDLYDLIASAQPARTAETDVTLFKNGGGAHLDLMVAVHIVESLTKRRGSSS